MWYVRREVAKGNAAVYLMGNAASGFGGIIAYAVYTTICLAISKKN
jgi:hypothetical protein